MIQKRSGFKVLVLTDSGLHSSYESLYPVLRHLTGHPDIASVAIADRANQDNKNFYQDRIKVNALYCFDIDDKYGYDTRGAYATQARPLGDFDAVWLLLDHPVTEGFLTYLLKMLDQHFVMNDPLGLMETSSKAFLLELQNEQPGLARYLPPMALCRSAEDVESFKARHPDLVLKALRGYGGKGVVRYKNGNTDLKNSADVQTFLDAQGGECLAMKYISAAKPSDRRTIVMKGEIIGSILRTPGEGNWLCNVGAGGQCEVCDSDMEERALVQLLDPLMQERGIYIYGLDMLENNQGQRMLSEINTLNVGGISLLEKMTGAALSKRCADIFTNTVKDYYSHDDEEGIIDGMRIAY